MTNNNQPLDNNLKNYNTKTIIELFKSKHKQFIIDNLKNLSKNQIFIILKKEDNNIAELKELLLNPNLAISCNNDKEFFKNLPKKKRNLIAYYGYNCFELEYFGYNKTEYKNNLKDLLTEQFKEFPIEIIEQLINFYGTLSSRTIDFVIRNLLIDINYLEHIKEYAKEYFDSNINQTIKFQEKYPDLSTKLFQSKIQILNKTKELLKVLSEKSVLEKIDELDINNLDNIDINNYSYSTNEKTLTGGKIIKGSLDNYNINTIIFTKNSEIIKIDISGNIENYEAYSHIATLQNMYENKLEDTRKKEILEIINEATLTGDILVLTENAGLSIWLPPTLTSLQKDLILNLLKSITEKENQNLSVYLAYTIPNNQNEFVAINDGQTITLSQSIEEINKIKIDDKSEYLNTKKLHRK